ATPVPDAASVTQAQKSGTPTTQTAGKPAAVPTTVPGLGTVFAPPHTIDASADGKIVQAAPIVVTPTGSSSIAIGSVRDVQRALNTLGGVSLEEHGFLDGDTSQAIKAFQARNARVADGTAGPATKAALVTALTAVASAGKAQNGAVAAGYGCGFGFGAAESALGMRAYDVQRALNVLGISPPLVETGRVDARTVAAVKSFQVAAGLIPDGIAGPKTKTALWIEMSQNQLLGELASADPGY
ncbi:MAG: peptidoglycan-binding protein, partial [Alphaproteobacteria bacterium]|nr:peptidoglycan-binding protein [Alphaproteobacteria bacterium]